MNDVALKTKALISVASLVDPGDWAYLHAEPGKLYVRDGTETIPLLGTKADNYKRRSTQAPD